VAVDTAAKRRSAAAVRLPFPLSRRILVAPDGTIGQADRQSLARAYAGILASVPSAAPTVEDVGSGFRRRLIERVPRPVRLRGRAHKRIPVVYVGLAAGTFRFAGRAHSRACLAGTTRTCVSFSTGVGLRRVLSAASNCTFRARAISEPLVGDPAEETRRLAARLDDLVGEIAEQRGLDRRRRDDLEALVFYALNR